MIKTLELHLRKICESEKDYADFFWHIYTQNRKEELCANSTEILQEKLKAFEATTFQLHEPRGHLWIDFGVEHGYKKENRADKTLLFNRPTCLKILDQACVNAVAPTSSIDQYFYMHDICGGSGEPNRNRAPHCAYVQLYHCDRTAYTSMLGGPFDRVRFFDCVFQNDYYQTMVDSALESIDNRAYRCRQEWRITKLAFDNVMRRADQITPNLAQRRAFYAIPSKLLAKLKRSIIYTYSYFAKLSATRGYAISRNPIHRNFMYLCYVLLKFSTKGLTINLKNAGLRKLILGDTEDTAEILEASAGERDSFNIDLLLREHNFLFFNKDQVDFVKMTVSGNVANSFNHVSQNVIYGGTYVDSLNSNDEDPLLELLREIHQLLNTTPLVPKDIASTLFAIFGKEMIAKIPKVHRCFQERSAEQLQMEADFDVTSLCNYQIALSKKIKLKSMYERYRLYFDNLPILQSRKRMDGLAWKNMVFLDEWMYIKARLISHKSIFKHIDQYLFSKFCKLKYLPCSYKDRVWSIYTGGKLLKLLDTKDLPKFPVDFEREPLKTPHDVRSADEESDDDLARFGIWPITPTASPKSVPKIGKPVIVGERGPLGSQHSFGITRKMLEVPSNNVIPKSPMRLHSASFQKNYLTPPTKLPAPTPKTSSSNSYVIHVPSATELRAQRRASSIVHFETLCKLRKRTAEEQDLPKENQKQENIKKRGRQPKQRKTKNLFEKKK